MGIGEFKNEDLEGLLYCVYAGEMGFSDFNHLRNFLKYLYGGKSGRHVVNEHTENNVFSEDVWDEGSYKFTDKPFDLYHSFLRRFGDDFANYDLYRNDVFYVPFLLKIKGRLVTNFIQTGSNGSPVIHFQDGDGEAILETIAGMYPNGKSGFVSAIENILDNHGEPFIRYQNCSGEERLIIERAIHKESSKLVKKNVILSISHDDQFETHPTYHLHRLYRI